MNCGLGSRSSSNSADSLNNLVLKLQTYPIEGRGVTELGGTPSVSTLSSLCPSWEHNSVADFTKSDLDSEISEIRLSNQNRLSSEFPKRKFPSQTFPTRPRRGAEYPARRISPLKFPSSKQPFRRQRRGAQFPARRSSLSFKFSLTPPSPGQANALQSVDAGQKKLYPLKTASRVVPRKSTLLFASRCAPVAPTKATRNRETSHIMESRRYSENEETSAKVLSGPCLLSVTSDAARIMLAVDVEMRDLRIWAEELEKINDASKLDAMSAGRSVETETEIPFVSPGIPIVATVGGLKRNTSYELKMNVKGSNSAIWIFRTLSSDEQPTHPSQMRSKMAFVFKDRIIYHPNCQPSFPSKSPSKNLYENVLRGNVVAVHHLNKRFNQES